MLYSQEEILERNKRKIALFKKLSNKEWRKWCIIRIPEYQNSDFEVLYAKPDAHTWSAYIENWLVQIPMWWTANMCQWKLVLTTQNWSEVFEINKQYIREKYNETINEYFTRCETIWNNVTYWYILDLLKKYNPNWYFCEVCKDLDSKEFYNDWITWCKTCKNKSWKYTEMIYIRDCLDDLWKWFNSSLLKQSIECIEFLEKIFYKFDIDEITKKEKEEEKRKYLEQMNNHNFDFDNL